MPSTPRSFALRLIKNRLRSCAEVDQALQKRGVEQQDREHVIEELTAAGLLDDTRLARAWVNDRDRFNPRGEMLLRLELKKKGISDSIIRETLSNRREREEEPVDEFEQAKTSSRSQRRPLSELTFRDQKTTIRELSVASWLFLRNSASYTRCMSTCQWLHQIETGQEATWGTEATTLAVVARQGVPVLPGFVVSREAVFSFYLQPGLRGEIQKICKGLSIKKPEHFAGAAREVREVILKASLPVELRKTVAAYLEEMEDQLLHAKGKGLPLTLIAQSAQRQAHHGSPASATEAEKTLKQLLALDFTEAALYGRFQQEQSIVPAPYAVLVQYAPATELAGTIQQFDPQNHDGSILYAEVAHHEHPGADAYSDADVYRFDVKSLHLLSKTEGRHTWAAKKGGAHVSPRLAHKNERIDERQLRLLARFARRAQTAFPDVQRFHWQLFLDSIVISGVETISKSPAKAQGDSRMPLLIGHGVNPGVARGVIRLLPTKKSWDDIQDGDVVVVEQLAEKDIPRLAGIAALITESGHHTSIEAMAAKQLGIPAISGVATAGHVLRNGQLVTVDGTHGAVYAGRPLFRDLGPHGVISTLPITGTKIYAAIDDALLATPELLNESDGIGMLRGEFILRLLGLHPQEILRTDMAKEYVELLAEGVERAAKAAGMKPIIYQLHDLADHQFHGPRTWRREKHEPNQLIGFRGTHRLLSEPEILELELQALAKVQQKGYDNLSIMLPMVRSIDEIKKMRRLLRDLGASTEGLWVRVETPALTIRAADLAALQLGGVLFDAPALATLITGTDHENHQMAHHRDQADPAVQDALSFAIATCRKEGVATGIIAETEELRAELVEAAIKAGVTAVVARPTDCGWLHGLVASIEQRMLLDHLVGETI
jgi:pyruvate,water dikinase